MPALRSHLSFQRALCFSDAIRAPFAKAHRERPFDVIEGPEYGPTPLGFEKTSPICP